MDTQQTATAAARSSGGDYLHPDPGFIRHPVDRPISVRRLPFWRRRLRCGRSGMGIVFQHTAYLRPGTQIEVSIPLRGEQQCFQGHVVLVREMAGGYEIGLRLTDPDQGSRMRIVEQICYIESYLRTRLAAGQTLTANHAAREWIEHHAASFPSSS